METYNSALYLCARNADVYYPGQCYNTTNGYAWVGHLRFSFSTQGIYILQTIKKHGKHNKSLKSTKGVIRSRKSTKDGHYNSKKKEDKNGNKKEDKKNDKKEREQKWQTMIYKTLHRKLKID